ncbi:hypothetical protein KIN20_029581 [Parelaphostrongylus tenuis]|uniref:Lipoprotein n=1 Tax=Parelaphostrongylus tenuis TaxID=148309 RepID=A0AAD5WFS7_PARTN|nr:hypothetical protein KIN20_029581 [Parelaphostrongylus tenuis]
MKTKMNVSTRKAKIPTGIFMINLLATISTVLGCGVMPAGQDNHYGCSLRGESYGPRRVSHTNWPMHSCINSQFMLHPPAGRVSAQHKDTCLSTDNQEMFRIEFGQYCAKQLSHSSNRNRFLGKSNAHSSSIRLQALVGARQ